MIITRATADVRHQEFVCHMHTFMIPHKVCKIRQRTARRVQRFCMRNIWLTATISPVVGRRVRHSKIADRSPHTNALHKKRCPSVFLARPGAGRRRQGRTEVSGTWLPRKKPLDSPINLCIPASVAHDFLPLVGTEASQRCEVTTDFVNLLLVTPLACHAPDRR